MIQKNKKMYLYIYPAIKNHVIKEYPIKWEKRAGYIFGTHYPNYIAHAEISIEKTSEETYQNKKCIGSKSRRDFYILFPTDATDLSVSKITVYLTLTLLKSRKVHETVLARKPQEAFGLESHRPPARR